MKKYLFAMLGALFVFTACTTGKPENDGNKTTEEENDYITMYVASEVSMPISRHPRRIERCDKEITNTDKRRSY